MRKLLYARTFFAQVSLRFEIVTPKTHDPVVASHVPFTIDAEERRASLACVSRVCVALCEESGVARELAKLGVESGILRPHRQGAPSQPHAWPLVCGTLVGSGRCRHWETIEAWRRLGPLARLIFSGLLRFLGGTFWRCARRSGGLLLCGGSQGARCAMRCKPSAHNIRSTPFDIHGFLAQSGVVMPVTLSGLRAVTQLFGSS